MKQAETKIVQKEKQLAQQEEAIVKKEGEIEQMKANYEAQLDIAEKKDQELNRLHQQAIDKLESIAGMSAEEAKNNMIESLKAEADTPHHPQEGIVVFSAPPSTPYTPSTP